MSKLSVYDFRDTDLMAKVAENGASGVSSKEIAESLGFKEDDGTQSVGMRFAWMKKFGMLEYDAETKLWMLTAGGERVIESHIRAAATRTIEAVPDESMVEVMAHVTSRYRLGDPMIATLLRREFQYGTNPRSSIFRR